MASEPSEADKVAAPPVVAFKKRGGRPKGSIMRKRPASPKPTDDSSGDSSSDDDGVQHRAKRRNKTAAVTATSASNNTSSNEIFATTFEADRKATLAKSDDATKRVDWHEGEKPKIGPTKTSANVRMTIATDFAPDVCKDYKKTGFCGYGDNCIYAHVREDFQAGWQLDHEWEKINKGGKNPKGTTVASANRDKKGEDNEEDEEFLEKIPFACIICEGSYRAPIITRCGHYFCEPCALKRYRKDPTCAACSAGTNGVFNSAAKLNKLLERKRERVAKKEAEAAAAEAEDT
ncbi:hypothetical protein B0T10DRAFT_222659 [Thelonectria olida]|uniref:Pre-mRNA-splicing factor CWC24 n=1 Tax=Thelonectria olida TaxID=1576542 RepID=A0A9P9ATV7_9HYPO|nr:hypothetical protein B0T10DRAFT_222659 [Thelonectria olida]